MIVKYYEGNSGKHKTTYVNIDQNERGQEWLPHGGRALSRPWRAGKVPGGRGENLYEAKLLPIKSQKRQ